MNTRLLTAPSTYSGMCHHLVKGYLKNDPPRQCTFTPTVIRDGKLYCARHDPFTPIKVKPCCAKTAAAKEVKYKEKIREIFDRSIKEAQGAIEQGGNKPYYWLGALEALKITKTNLLKYLGED